MKRSLFILIVALTFVNSSRAQIAEVQLKTNVIYLAATFTPNLSAEVRLGNQFTLQVNGSYNPWNLAGSLENNKKLVHWIASVEGKYWLKEAFEGHVFSAEAIYSNYNISQQNLELIFESDTEHSRFEGMAYGVGLNYGYMWNISRRVSVDASVGLGYLRLNYDRFNCVVCSEKQASETANYFGPTKVSVSFGVKLGVSKNKTTYK